MKKVNIDELKEIKRMHHYKSKEYRRANDKILYYTNLKVKEKMHCPCREQENQERSKVKETA